MATNEMATNEMATNGMATNINRLKIFASFSTTEEMTKVVKLIWGEDLPDNWALVEDDSYTHAILLNTSMPADLTIPKERVIGLAMEPFIGFPDIIHPFLNITDEFIEYAKTHIGRYLLGAPFYDEFGKMPKPFEARYSYLTHAPAPPPDYIPATIRPNKPLFSIMVSHKTYAPGHAYRHTLVKQLLKIPDFPIHVYGNGCEPYEGDPRVMGGFTKHQIMYDEYPFHICIENFGLPHYFSEKIINPMLCGCTPIYLGCTKIDEYIPTKGGIIQLTSDVNQDILLLYKIIRNPELYKEKHTPSRQKVREITSLFKHINKLF